MPNFQLPKTTALDVNDALPGAKAKFFLSGTSTPEPVFADAALTTAIGVEVIADGDGRFSPIYLDRAKVYKLTLTDSNDVVQYTTDPVEPLSIQGQDVGSRISRLATTPIDFGAVGDGVADETIFVQQAINAATYAVDLVGGTYRCVNTLTVPSNRKISNGRIDSSDLTGAVAIEISGNMAATSTSTTSVSNVGSVSIDVLSTSSFSPGDFVYVSCPTVNWSPSATIAEIMRVEQINSSTQMTFDTGLSATYASGTTTVTRMNMVSDVTIDNVKFSGDGISPNSAIGTFAANNIRINNCDAERFGSNGISITKSNDVEIVADISQCGFNGVYVDEGCNQVLVTKFSIRDCAASGIKVGVGSGVGINKFISAQIGVIKGCAEGITFSANSYGCTATVCSAVAGSIPMQIGINNAGSNNTVSNCGAAGASLAGIFHAIEKSNNFTSTSGRVDTPSIVITDNVVTLCGASGIKLSDVSTSVGMVGVNVSGNKVNAISGDGIQFSQSFTTYTNTNVLNNSVDQCSGKSISINLGTNGSLVSYSVINNNMTRHAGTDGLLIAGFANKITTGNVTTNNIDTTSPVLNSLHLVNVNSTSVSGNTVSGGVNGTHIEYTASPANGDLTVNANVTKNVTGTELKITTSVTVRGINIINNNYFSGGSSNAIFIDLSASGGLLRSSVIGNTVNSSFVNNILVKTVSGSNISDLIFSNNILSIAATGRNIFGDFASGSVVTGLIISGNNTITGTLGNIVLAHGGGGGGIAKIIGNICNSAGTGSGIEVVNFSYVDIKDNTSNSATNAAFRYSANTGGPTKVSIRGNTCLSNASSIVRVDLDGGQTLSYLDIGANAGNALTGIPAILISLVNSSQLSRFIIGTNNITAPLFDWATPPAPSGAVAGPGITINSGAGCRVNSGNIFGNNLEFLTNGIYLTGTGSINRTFITGNHFPRCLTSIRRDATTFAQIFAGGNYIDEPDLSAPIVGTSAGDFDGATSIVPADFPNFVNDL